MMNNDEILKTAFFVWGKTFYQKSSLSDLAAALGVTKPALYRHFMNKDVLFEAMSAVCYDRFADFIRADYEECINGIGGEDKTGKVLRLAFTFAEYFLRNKDDFTFIMIKGYGTKNPAFSFTGQLKKRGIDLFLARPDGGGGLYPPLLQLTAATIFFMVARFHKQRRDDKSARGALRKNRPSQSEGRMKGAMGAEDELVFVFKGTIEKLVQKGLALDGEKIAALEYDKLESMVQKDAAPGGDGDETHEKLLHAVITAIAEAGPWEVTMEMVAKYAGLSKSSLYSHFENRDEMIKRVFLGEIERMEAYAEQCSSLSDGEAEERLYLIIFGVVSYLQTRSNVLGILDGLRGRRPCFKKCSEAEYKKIFEHFYQIFDCVKKDDGLVLVSERNAEWIMFLIINFLLRRAARNDSAELPPESFRRLFRFIAGGVGTV
jgi:AcrR family transcriptional regulator